MPYSKPYLTILQQISRLQARGMEIESSDFAELCLQKVGYYRLSAYYYPYRAHHQTIKSKRLDNFQTNTTFNQISALYDFDRRLRLLVMDAIEKIEIACRAIITTELGKRGMHAHLNSADLDGLFTRSRITKSGRPQMARHAIWLQKMSEKFDNSKEEFVNHFKTSYPNESPPLWIASELWDFGMMSHLLSGLKYTDRQAVSQYFSVSDPLHFCSWIRSINFIRNVCAHHSRFWNKGIVDQPKIPSAGLYPELDHLAALNLSHHKIYTTLAIINFLVKRTWPNSQWGERVKELISQFPEDNIVNISQAGFPPAWETLPLWN